MARTLSKFFRRMANEFTSVQTPDDMDLTAMAGFVATAQAMPDVTRMGGMPDDSETGLSAAVHAFLSGTSNPEDAARMAWANPVLG